MGMMMVLKECPPSRDVWVHLLTLVGFFFNKNNNNNDNDNKLIREAYYKTYSEYIVTKWNQQTKKMWRQTVRLTYRFCNFPNSVLVLSSVRGREQLYY